MRHHVLVLTLIAATTIFGFFGISHVPINVSIADDSSSVATERWETKTVRVLAEGVWAFSKKPDGTVTVTGEWAWEDNIQCPFKDVVVTVSGPSFSFDVKGKGINSVITEVTREPRFRLRVKGEMYNGKGNGTFKLDFFDLYLPSGFKGNWTGTRIEGKGVFKQT